MILIFGAFELGLAFRDYLTIANMTRAGARVVSAGGTSLTSDFDAVSSTLQAGNALPNGSIERIVVYKVDPVANPEGTPVCTTGPSQPGVCNVYDANDLATMTSADFGCHGGPKLDKKWCPDTRDDTQAGDTDRIGVYVRVHHDSITGLIPVPTTISDFVVMKIEPRRS